MYVTHRGGQSVLVPQRDLRSSGVLGPCCPARSASVLGCWRRTGPDCTGGPAASLGLSRALSSALWPSALCGSSWWDLSPLRGMLWTGKQRHGQIMFENRHGLCHQMGFQQLILIQIIHDQTLLVVVCVILKQCALILKFPSAEIQVTWGRHVGNSPGTRVAVSLPFN